MDIQKWWATKAQNDVVVSGKICRLLRPDAAGKPTVAGPSLNRGSRATSEAPAAPRKGGPGREDLQAEAD